MNIGYVVFGQNTMNYGMAYCLHRSGIDAQMASVKTAKHFDYLLFSIFWWQHVIDFYAFCKAAGIGKNKANSPIIIVGGFNSFNPVVFKKYAHYVCIGDGEDLLAKIIAGESSQSIYTGTETDLRYNNADISDNHFLYYNEAKIARIEVARGCKYKCKFCQLSALKKYREVSIDAIEIAIKNSSSNRVVMFAPNRTSHSRFLDIKALLEKYKKVDMCPDVRFNETDLYFGQNAMQIGIEGISERLRYSAGKKLSNDGFRELIARWIVRRMKEGKKPTLFLGYIMDLPTETPEDWKEFSDFLDSVSAMKDADKLVLFFVFNQFQPLPFTRFEDETISFSNHREKVKKVLYDRRFKICVKGRPFGDVSRLLSLVCTRGDENTDLVVDRIQAIKDIGSEFNKIKRIDWAIKEYGGIQRYIGKPISKPWEIIKL